MGMVANTTKRRFAVGVALLLTVVSACGSNRPAVDDWQSSWVQISASIPGEASLAASDSVQTVCADTLVFLRSNRSELFPTPDLAIDGVVTAWIEIAEDAFFECPPSSEQIGDFAEAYAEMSRLEAEIELVLDMDRNE